MIRTRFLIAAVLVPVAVLSPVAAADDSDDKSSIRYGLSFLVNKWIVDPLWDAVNGKPDVDEIKRRLQELENNAALRSEVREEIRKLRESVNDRVTLDEFRRMAEEMNSAIGSIQRRLDDVEESVEKLQVENDDLKNGTKNGTDAQFFLRRGAEYENQKQMYKAVACYNIAIRLAPTDAALYRARCRYYVAMGAPGVGVPDAAESIRLDPKNASGYRYRGIGETAARDFDAAIKDFVLAEIHEPGYSDAAYDHIRAVAYAGRGYPFLPETRTGQDFQTWRSAPLALDRALQSLNEAIRIDPNYAAAFDGRSSVYFGLERWQDSLVDANEAIRLDPKHAEFYLSRCSVYLHGTKEYDKAIDDATTAIRLGPRDGGKWFFRDAYLRRAMAYKENGDVARSKADYETVKRIVAEIRARDN